MAKFNQQPNKTSAGTNIQEVKQQNSQTGQGSQGQYGTEFASETNAQEVRQQNARSAQGSKGQYGTEFASETNAQEVKKQNQAAEARKSQNSGQSGQS